MASLNDNARTDASSVSEIFDTELTNAQLKAHINAAAALVDDVESTGSVPDQRLELIETYVAAHFAASQDPREKEAEVGDAAFTYQGPEETTQYWETATSLDPTGVLSGNTTQVGFEVMDSR